MRRILTAILFLAALSIFCLLQLAPDRPAFAQEPAFTPTYDPLIGPPLPAHPSDYELGRNLFWHWCMTCHGDRGQGLTDEFRKTWVEDHQNCWARGCHAGHNHDLGFPIPTVVPLIIGDGHLARFASLQDLISFLRKTHPPQQPGTLKDEEYQAIAVYVFTENGRSLVSATPSPASTQSATTTPSPAPTRSRPAPLTGPFLWPAVLAAALGLAGIVLVFRIFRSKEPGG